MGIISASDLTNVDNISAEQGRRGYRGITGPQGRPGRNGNQGAPGLPGPSGSSKIDINFQGDTLPYFYVDSSKYKPIANIIFPGTTEWGRDLVKFKIACSFDKNIKYKNFTTLKAYIKVEDITNSLNVTEILSSPLVAFESITGTAASTINYSIAQNGDALNTYTTFQNLPASSAIFRVSVQMASFTPFESYVDSALNIYAIEIY